MKIKYLKFLLFLFVIIISVSSFGQVKDREIIVLKDRYSKTINGYWKVDSLKSKVFQQEITIKNLTFNSDKSLLDGFKSILNSYLDDYGFKRKWTDKFEILNTGSGNILFYLGKFSNMDYPRTSRYCFFKQEENYFLLLLTDLEDRNEEISLLFEVESLPKKTKSMLINHEEFGEFKLNKE